MEQRCHSCDRPIYTDEAVRVLHRKCADQDELRQAVRTILRGFDEGVFGRSIDGDNRTDWAVKLLPFIGALSEAQRLVGGNERAGEK